MTNPSSSITNPIVEQSRKINVGSVEIGGEAPLCLIAGPCVIESRDHVMMMAEELHKLCTMFGMPLVFKASFDKANRSAGSSYRGPGLEKGLEILAEVKSRFEVPILTDIHELGQAGIAAQVCDILQIPAFLCRQTDFVQDVGRAGKAVNVKKGQFLAPWDVGNVVDKLVEVGCENILLTERGTTFGYGHLVTDFRSIPIMQSQTGFPVCFDATHSVQEPGALGNATGGKREFVPMLCRAACAVGVSSLFIETHDNPALAKSDGPNMVPLADMRNLLAGCIAIDAVVRGFSHGPR